MACSIEASCNIEERENSEVLVSNPPPGSVVDSAVVVDFGVSDSGLNSPELDDNGRSDFEKKKVKKVTFLGSKRVDSTVDLEKGVDVKVAEEATSGDDDVEKVCRVCHLSSDNRSVHGDLIQIGCGCKNDLGIAHKHCAEAWFKIRGNRLCEICGEAAKNIAGVGDAEFMEEWNENDASHSSSAERPRCWRGRPFCNFLMACMVVAFILPWFFRVSMF